MDDIELGVVSAERTMTLFRPDGSAGQITLCVGKPSKDPQSGDYYCPLQIVGAGDERVRAAWGEDAFVALQYAINLIGQILDDVVNREKLEVRFRPADHTQASWIWRYPTT